MNRDNEYIPLLSWPSFSEKKICRYQHGNGAREKSHFYRFRMLYLLTYSKHTLLPMQLHIKGLCPNSYLVSNIQYDMVNSSHHLGWCFWMRLTSEWANRVGLVLLIGRLKSKEEEPPRLKGSSWQTISQQELLRRSCVPFHAVLTLVLKLQASMILQTGSLQRDVLLSMCTFLFLIWS